jgi:hypothetical protein
MRLASAALVCLGVAPLIAASYTVVLDPRESYCQDIHLPAWTRPANLPSHHNATWDDWAHTLSGVSTSDFDFRDAQGGILVGLSITPDFPPGSPHLASPNRYFVSLPQGSVRKASETEWARANRIFPTRKWPPGLWPDIRDKATLSYRGLEFPRRLLLWPYDWLAPARLSETGDFITIQTWNGLIYDGGGALEFGGGTSHGNYRFEIFDARSGRSLFSVNGTFRNTDTEFFAESAWLGDRYFVINLDTDRKRRFVICDVQKALRDPH